MKISLIHDWLRVNAGSEKVVRELLLLFGADDVELFTLFNTLAPQDRSDILGDRTCHTSWLQVVPLLNRMYKGLLPLMPLFIRQLKVRPANLYVSSSHAVAKGFRRPDGMPHICYCHTPMRYAWYLREDYLKDLPLWVRLPARILLNPVRRWDFSTARNVDHFIANSRHIQEQIRAVYGRESIVIHPPVQTERFMLNSHPRQDYFLAVGRFVPYKKMDIIIRAFRDMPQHKLVLIGEGGQSRLVQALLQGVTNIVWLGYQHEDELRLYMQHARACIFAAKEDFGITCVEAQATGTPVLALNYGGYRDTVVEGLSGMFFSEQTPEAIQHAVNRFMENPLTNYTAIRKHAERFSAERFRHEMRSFVEQVMRQAHG